MNSCFLVGTFFVISEAGCHEHVNHHPFLCRCDVKTQSHPSSEVQNWFQIYNYKMLVTNFIESSANNNTRILLWVGG